MSLYCDKHKLNCYKFLLELNSREEISRLYFGNELTLDSEGSWELDNEVDNIDKAFSLSISGDRFGVAQSQMQLLMLEEENTRAAVHREAEVRQIVKSIVDLNDIFKELSHMVADQVSYILMLIMKQLFHIIKPVKCMKSVK